LRGTCGCPPTRWFVQPSSGSPMGNAANPRTGSGMQQARDLRAEETVEVVQNHEDGTGFSRMAPRGPKPTATWVGVDARRQSPSPFRRCGVGGGARALVPDLRRKPWCSGSASHESHERRSEVRPGQQVVLCRGAKARGSARFHSPRGGWSRRGAVGTPRRPARQRARSGRERGRPTEPLRPRRGHGFVIGFRWRHARPLKVR
jgi:hypothetical protein